LRLCDTHLHVGSRQLQRRLDWISLLSWVHEKELFRAKVGLSLVLVSNTALPDCTQVLPARRMETLGDRSWSQTTNIAVLPLGPGVTRHDITTPITLGAAPITATSVTVRPYGRPGRSTKRPAVKKVVMEGLWFSQANQSYCLFGVGLTDSDARHDGRITSHYDTCFGARVAERSLAHHSFL
jgi:hypothetical protein